MNSPEKNHQPKPTPKSEGLSWIDSSVTKRRETTTIATTAATTTTGSNFFFNSNNNEYYCPGWKAQNNVNEKSITLVFLVYVRAGCYSISRFLTVWVESSEMVIREARSR
mmetsp:Transcript_18749/g.32053  ORF Transcript_18749/g.32053 Transcript_18749/m.32053 type:complete len:110 (+) Transcript_18749:978-1307(+)